MPAAEASDAVGTKSVVFAMEHANDNSPSFRRLVSGLGDIRLPNQVHAASVQGFYRVIRPTPCLGCWQRKQMVLDTVGSGVETPVKGRFSRMVSNGDF
jgi:hypothetical protein